MGLRFDTVMPIAVESAKAPVAPNDGQPAPEKWIVNRVRRSRLLRASDHDRESAAMFHYGYPAVQTQSVRSMSARSPASSRRSSNAVPTGQA